MVSNWKHIYVTYIIQGVSLVYSLSTAGVAGDFSRGKPASVRNSESVFRRT